MCVCVYIYIRTDICAENLHMKNQSVGEYACSRSPAEAA